MMKIGKYSVGKECGGKWFPGIGHGYWEGLERAFQIRLGFRRFDGGFAFGPLMFFQE
jgi:hypothetical protein